MFSLHDTALCWLRYGKRLPVVCTEAGSWNADVIGMNGSMCIEVEIKKSVSDLRADFKNKPQKHYVYAHAEEFDGRSLSGYVPNYFYFFVPLALEEKAREIINEKMPKAGLAVVDFEPRFETHLGRSGVRVSRPPKKLHDSPPSNGFLRQAIMRMSSEICGFRIALGRLKKEELTQVLVKALTQVAADSTGALDFEDVLADMEERGAELAWAVERKPWKSLSHAERFRWIASAVELLEIGRRRSKDVRNAAIN